MKSIAHGQISSILHSTPISNFSEWKSFREKIIPQIGELLLSFDESELATIYSNWEEEVSESYKKNQPNEIYISLLIISIMHYFRRSYDQTKKTDVILQCLSMPNRDICKIAAKVLRDFAKESTESVPFLRRALNLAKAFLVPSQRNLMTFNALTIVKNVGPFLEKDAFAVTLGNLPEIFNASTSDDQEMCVLASKVMMIHLKALPSHSCLNFANSMAMDYMLKIANSPNAATPGMVFVLKYIYKLYPAAIKVDELITKLMSICTSPYSRAAPDAIDFLTELTEEKKFSLSQTSELILLAINVLLVNPSKRLFEQFILILQTVPVENIPIQSVMQMLSYFVTNDARKKWHNKAFKVLCALLKIKPIDVPKNFFGSICKHSIRAISMLPEEFEKHKEDLLKVFSAGVDPNAPIQQRKISIRLASTFKTKLFLSMPPLFDVLKHNSFSSDQKMRRLMAETLPLFECDKAMDELVRMAVMDTSEYIRLIAIRSFTDRCIYRNPSIIVQLLADPSIAVRREAIPIVAKCAEKCGFVVIPQIIIFSNEVLDTRFQSIEITHDAQMYSLLPLIAKYFVKFSAPLATTLAYLCIHMYLGEIPPTAEGFKDIGKLIHRDLESAPATPETPYCRRLAQIVTKKMLNERDTYLFETIGELSTTLTPFLYQVIPVFIKAFRSKTSQSVYIAALNALTKIARDSKMKINIPKIFPTLTTDIIRLISRSSFEVARAALQCTGTMGISDVDSKNANVNEDVVEVCDMKKSSFYTNFVINCVKELLKNEKSLPVLNSVACIIIYDTDNALPSLRDLVPSFIEATSNETIREKVFGLLEMIVYKCKYHIMPFIDMFRDIAIKYFNEIPCINLCVRLSYTLTREFQETASELYPLALKLALETENNSVLKELLRFICSCILYQNQPFEQFVELAESMSVMDEHDIQISFIFKSLSLLVQNITINIFASRLSRLALSVLQRKSLHTVQQFVFSLVDNGCLSINTLKNSIDVNVCKLPLEELERDPSSLVKHQVPTLPPPKMLEKPQRKASSIFQNMAKPTYLNATQWIDGICRNAVASSPSVSMRSCLPIINQSQTFASEMYPIAFVSCWREATDAEKNSFSQIIKLIIEKFTDIDQRVIDFIDIVDKSGYPLVIPDDVIANGCRKTAHKLYLLQREYIKTKDPKIARQLLELNTKMGRTESARGILKNASTAMEQTDAGKWRMLLGEWETALSIYETTNDVSSIISCYGHLEMWDKLRQMEKSFEMLTPEQQSTEAMWYAWAFYYSNEQEKVNYYISKFDKNQVNHISFCAIYYLKTKQYDLAERCISHAFDLIANDRSVFNGSDERQASVDLTLAEHLVELKEVLEVKKGDVINVTDIWQNRLANFSHESDTWMKTSEVRSLILSSEDHLDSYLKMLSVLRQERRWRLADSHCERFFSERVPPRVMVEELKIMWERGNKKRAISLISTINELCRTNQMPKETSAEDLAFLKKLTCKFTEIPDETKARLLKLQAIWQYSLYSSKTSSADTLKDICLLFMKSNKLRNNDPKTWAGWAYASSRALSHFPEKRSLFAESAMTGFLKAAKLSPRQSLEFMCQTFSIFFRYGAETGLSSALRQEFYTLPPSTVALIVPQIAVHITDVDSTIRTVVQNILNRFGETHFQAVVYSLNTLSLISNKEKSSIATEFLNKLGQKHIPLYKESMLFIDGMHRSAVSWNELCMTHLDNASRASAMGDRETAISILQSVFEGISEPKCKLDNIFIKSVGPQINRSKQFIDGFKKGDQRSTKILWGGLREVYMHLVEKMKHVDVINLNDVSEELAQKTQFSLAVPGLYSINGKSNIIQSIDKTLFVMSTQQHPRIVWIRDTDGNRWKFLLKGNEDLRLDQRIMQFFMLINSMLMSNRATGDLGVNIVEYSITPFAPNAGLISWVTGSDTIQELVTEFRSRRPHTHPSENEILSENVGQLFNSLNSLQRYEVFEKVAEKTPATEIREMLWLRSPSPTVWLQRNRCFTISTALMSMAGYVIGLGDRHPSNIMVQKHTGKVIHIDFGDSFEVAMNRKGFPERVPFRLTRMIENALDGSSVEGIFNKACEDVMWVLRNGSSSIMSQLEVFVHEPIFYGKEVKTNENKAKGVLERIASKLAGTDNSEKEQDVHEQVLSLIGRARDPKEYIRHYIGWCPFW